MKKHLSTIFLFLGLLAGLSLMLYPTFANFWNLRHQSRAIASYSDTVENMAQEDYSQMWDDARVYNKLLLRKSARFYMPDDEREWYNTLLNVSGNGIMGYIEIPKIDVRLPIYHGTDEAVLQIAIGHIEGSSLPTGEPGTHCALSGHTGLPSMMLFTDLNMLIEGDIFMLYVLDQVFTYEVDQFSVVLPDEFDALEVDPDENYVTLATCTPYGINSHRLLVRGHRVENADVSEVIRITSDAVNVKWYKQLVVYAIPLLLITLIVFLFRTRRKR